MHPESQPARDQSDGYGAGREENHPGKCTEDAVRETYGGRLAVVEAAVVASVAAKGEAIGAAGAGAGAGAAGGGGGAGAAVVRVTGAAVVGISGAELGLCCACCGLCKPDVLGEAHQA